MPGTIFAEDDPIEDDDEKAEKGLKEKSEAKNPDDPIEDDDE